MIPSTNTTTRPPIRLMANNAAIIVEGTYGSRQGGISGVCQRRVFVTHCATRALETRTSLMYSAQAPYVASYIMPDSGRRMRSAFRPPASARQGYHKLVNTTFLSSMTRFYSITHFYCPPPPAPAVNSCSVQQKEFTMV